MDEIKNCDEGQKEEPMMISNHQFVETYNDGKTQVLKCEVCGFESVGWTGKATVTKS